MTAQQVQNCGWFRTLTAAEAALATRGGDATALTVRCDVDKKDATQSMIKAAGWCLLMFLIESGVRIRELSMDYHWRDASGLSEKLLSQAAAGLASSLVSLRLDGYNMRLPPPEQLPQLRELLFHIRQEDEQLYGEIQAHIPTLTSLQFFLVDEPAYVTEVLAGILQPPHSLSHTLTELTGDILLTTELVSLILDRLPALRRLGVHSVAVSDLHVGRQWAVEGLSVQFSIPDGYDSSENIDLSSLHTLTLLPQSTAERLCVEAPGCMYLCFKDAQVSSCAVLSCTGPYLCPVRPLQHSHTLCARHAVQHVRWAHLLITPRCTCCTVYCIAGFCPTRVHTPQEVDVQARR